jgi:hypothetical protein
MSLSKILFILLPLAAACGGTDPETPGPEPTGETPPGPPPEITWAALPTDNAPSPRHSHTAIWTGTSMIVWGGDVGGAPSTTNTGGLFDPASKTWKSTSASGAPAARFGHTAVWTGSKMLIWGGYGAMNLEPAGGIYDPATDTWSPMSTAGQPSPRFAHTAVWTGSKMVIWGGSDGKNVSGNGAMYDPATDTWTATNMAGAPKARRYHGAAWSGSLMLVWSGYDVFDWLNDGAYFDPAGGPSGVWIRATNPTGAPVHRERATVSWTGQTFLGWGGWTGGPHTNTGGLLDPDANAWTAMNEGAPAARADHVGVWAGDHLVVFGGCLENICATATVAADGGRYVPWKDGGKWYPLAAQPALAGRYGATGVYTGNSVIVWGGRLDPATRTNTGAEAPL